MRIRTLHAMFFALAILITGCSSDGEKGKSGGAANERKPAPTKNSNPSEGS